MKKLATTGIVISMALANTMEIDSAYMFGFDCEADYDDAITEEPFCLSAVELSELVNDLKENHKTIYIKLSDAENMKTCYGNEVWRLAREFRHVEITNHDRTRKLLITKTAHNIDLFGNDDRWIVAAVEIN